MRTFVNKLFWLKYLSAKEKCLQGALKCYVPTWYHAVDSKIFVLVKCRKSFRKPYKVTVLMEIPVRSSILLVYSKILWMTQSINHCWLTSMAAPGSLPWGLAKITQSSRKAAMDMKLKNTAHNWATRELCNTEKGIRIRQKRNQNMRWKDKDTPNYLSKQHNTIIFPVGIPWRGGNKSRVLVSLGGWAKERLQWDF